MFRGRLKKDSPLARGNRFNEKCIKYYDYNDVHLSNGKRLDSYDPVAGEIISRKATDLDKISEKTYRKYLSEFKDKYSNGTKICSDKYKNDDGGVPPIDGRELKGKYILEIPASNKNLSNIEHYKKIAEEYGVTLRFREE